MSLRNPVIWHEGDLIRPNHFQQQSRYHDYIARRHGEAASAYHYGLQSFELNSDILLQGRIMLLHASGIFPDGTVFECPNEVPLPQALDISGLSVVDETIYLALPLWSSDLAEITNGSDIQEIARQSVLSQTTRDMASSDNAGSDINVGTLRLRLMLERDNRASYSCIPIARIREKRDDGCIVLDKNFMPMACDIAALPELRRVLEDLYGLIRQRSFHIAERLGTLHQGSVASVADFMMLQALNRLAPIFRHISSLNRVHPERLYETLASAAAEIATFTHETRISEDWPAYMHQAPHLCLAPVVASLRRSLATILEPNAVTLNLKKHKFGILTATVQDRRLFNDCFFVLAVRAAVPLDRLTKTFPTQVKVSSIDKIRELINLHLPGITLHPMAAAPRQLPYHAGYVYFLLDHNCADWKELEGSSGFAFHIAGNFPELEIQFWAVRTRQSNGGSRLL